MANDVEYDAATEACRQLAMAHDRFAELEQVLVAEGRYTESQGAHEYAMRLLRAYQAEVDNPPVGGTE